jgi:hypothetical protein
MFAAKAEPSSASNRTQPGSGRNLTLALHQFCNLPCYPLSLSGFFTGCGRILVCSWRLKDAGNSMTLPLKRRIEKSLGPFFDPLYLFYLLVDDLNSWRYFPKWFSSFHLGRSLMGQAQPWIPFEAENWLQLYVKPHMKVFEYGSGGSTIFFAERVAEVFTVEHDKKWHRLVSRALAQRGITNCSYQLHEPQLISTTPSALSPSSATNQSQNSPFIYDDYYVGMTVHEYVRAIDVHPNHTFDLVLVDGRARTECIQHAIPKIRPTAYLMLDNSNNADVAEIVHNLQSYPHIEFHGIAPGWPPTRWTNTIWQIS